MGNIFYRKWKKVDKIYKIALIGTFIIGLLTHMYMFTNKLPNHDYPYNIYGSQFRWPLMLGRWFLEPATVISSHFILPWMNGLLALLYVSLAAAFIVAIFKVKNIMPVLLCGGLLVTYPAFTDTAGFLFTADGYMMALLLSSVSVWVWESKKGKLKYILFALTLGSAVGIYQAYLSFAIYLILIRIILDIFEHRYTDKALLVKIGDALLCGICAVGFYYIMQRLVMKAAGVTFADYMGISDAGFLNFKAFASTLLRDTVSFTELFIGQDGSFTLFEILNGIFIILFLIIYIFLIVRRKLLQQKLQAAIFIVANILFIPSAYLWDFISEEVIYRLLMLYCVVLLYMLAVVLVDRYLPEWFGNGYLIFSIVMVFNFGLIDNIGYYNLNLCWEQTYATAIQMQDRLQQLEGYENTEEILILGTLQMKNENRREWVMDRLPPMIGIEDVNLMRNQAFIISILESDLGMILHGVGGERAEEIRQKDEVKKMGCWPAADSVKMVENVMIIKLED